MLRNLATVGRIFVQRSHIPSPAFRRILVIKPDHLGDVLLITPALRFLRTYHPRAAIVALVGPWSAPVLAHNPDINALLTLPFPGFERGHPPHPRPSRSHPFLRLLHAAALLRAGDFDTALLLRDDHWWGAALALLAGIPHRVGHAVPECGPFLTKALPWNPAQHVTRQALEVVTEERQRRATASPSAGSPPLVFLPPPGDVAWAAAWLAQHGLACDPATRRVTPPLVILHPGTGGTSKLWLPERWAAVVNALTAQYPIRVLLTGGPGEATLVQNIARLLHHPVLALVSTTSIGQLTALLGMAALVMGVDSGPLHLAVSQATPSLHLFGPGSAERFGPWGDRQRHRVLRADLWCAPCGVLNACPRGTNPSECMAALSTEQVVQAARCLLEQEGMGVAG
ncbi:MAG: glycosyltransferase family 9 protein [Chloroflexaceae bacterium]|nr:glycosyltransferase family 9 protein [Chloroflexaceae bacterium]